MAWWKRFFAWSRMGSAGSSLDLFREIYGGRESRSGVPVNWSRSLEVSTVLACCRVVANGVAQVPWRPYVDNGDSRQPARDHKLYPIISLRPNPWQTSFEFRETIMFHVMLTGNAFVFVNRIGRRREVRELVPIEPARVSVKRQPDLSLQYTIRGDHGEAREFAADAIWHLRGPSWNSWMGMEAVKLAREAIGLTISLEQGQAEFQKNGAQTSGVLSPKSKLTPERYEFLAAWLDKHLPGGERFGKPIIVDDDANYSALSMTAIDQQLIESRKHQIEEICRSFGVMPIMVGHTDKTATYASAEQMFLAHVVHTLAPWYQRIEQSADANILTEEDRDAGHYTKFTPNALMRGAAKDRGEFYAKALGSGGVKGWMTQNEVRAFEEMDRSLDPDADRLPQPTHKPARASAKPTSEDEENDNEA